MGFTIPFYKCFLRKSITSSFDSDHNDVLQSMVIMVHSVEGNNTRSWAVPTNRDWIPFIRDKPSPGRMLQSEEKGPCSGALRELLSTLSPAGARGWGVFPSETWER
ncbi:hypothetical protein CEXT_806651 [Caerostris extrusa]|uniref:Uncharacterized protein n=1 Tax=Caerostris extrusa TaxID=172846 RepID=A0AAV4UCG1_CAEEX|nr:hypothetical protein CEXT_806651 [Caerostris extrusa]